MLATGLTKLSDKRPCLVVVTLSVRPLASSVQYAWFRSVNLLVGSDILAMFYWLIPFLGICRDMYACFRDFVPFMGPSPW